MRSKSAMDGRHYKNPCAVPYRPALAERVFTFTVDVVAKIDPSSDPMHQLRVAEEAFNRGVLSVANPDREDQGLIFVGPIRTTPL